MSVQAHGSDAIGRVAIIGLAGRFPGAPNAQAFWQNLKQGVESITFFSDVELAGAGVAPEVLRDPNYVKARSVLEGVELFDAEFFGYGPREAEAMDPQQRLFLEGAWEALENAGYDPERYDGSIGLYAGLYMNTYLLANLCTSREFIEGLLSFKRLGAFQTFLGNDKDYLTTRVAYKLNLKGPALTVQTACSTSLVAVCQAYQSLINHQCDIALAGGITVANPQRKGYLFQEGGMVSPDGHCRAFDENAQGTVFGNGMGIVVLKRLADALADGDHIHAVIRGAALNNDGALKVSYTAPSVDGQAEVIALAQAIAAVEPESISYVEAHGTGTPLGDPIEIAALTQAFRARTPAKGFCGIGSVKTNIGHLDVAAGVAGLIKTTLALEHKLIPPSLNFSRPNPKIDFANSPFFVVNKLTEWKPGKTPRRAAVSSFGVGGTNAHVILEEAPAAEPASPSRPEQLLTLSAKTPAALDAATARLIEHLQANPDLEFADAAYTLNVGRRGFSHRRMLVCRDRKDALETLSRLDAKRVSTQHQEQRDTPVVFLFPGQGAQYLNMGAGLYRWEPVFREEVDRCAGILRPSLGLDLRKVIYPGGGASAERRDANKPGRPLTPSLSPDGGEGVRRTGEGDTCAHPTSPSLLGETRFTQPALFVVEYALARLWQSWGVKPQAMIGHSVGEYVAGCLAGVFSLEAALRLVAERARLVQAQPGGAMLAVRLSEEKARPLLEGGLAIAAVNSASLCVLAGPFDAVEACERRLKEEGVGHRRLQTSHAFHSAMMDPVVEPFTKLVRQVELRPPEIPYVSTLTGKWITPAEATDPNYWARHLRLTVRFADALSVLLQEPRSILLEVGPGQTLASLARQHSAKRPEPTVLSSLSAGSDQAMEMNALLNAVGRLWLSGVTIDRAGFYARERRHRVPLPTYPFERKRHWVEPPKHAAFAAAEGSPVPTRAAGDSVEPAPGGTAQEHETKECVMSQPQLNAAPCRKDRILGLLKSSLHELSGVDLQDKDDSTTFLELGFDSLFLTQARQSLQNKFGVKITYRQLSEDLSNLNALAAYIDQHLPPEAFPAEPAPPSSALETSPTGATPPAAAPCQPRNAPGVVLPDQPNARMSGAGSAGSLERILNQQLQVMSQLMAQQLAAIRGGQFEPALPDNQPAAGSSSQAAVGAGDGQSSRSKVQNPKSNGSEVAPEIRAIGTQNQSSSPPTEAPARVEAKPFGPYRPVARSADGSLTLRQQSHLARFIERFTKRTPNSKRLAQEFRQPLADPRSVAGFRKLWKELIYQIAVERSAGSKLWDVDGNEYIDVTMGFGVNLFGHLPAFVIEAVSEQLQKGVHIGPQSPLAGEVAELIREFTGLERVTFCNTGSEAVMAALRIARTITGRSKIVFFTGDYHGMFDEVLLRPQLVNGTLRSLPIAPGIPLKVGEDVLVLEYGTPESLNILRAEAQNLAAVLVEPVQSRRPELQPKEFLHELRQLTTASGSVLIFDEVITGFRVHPGGAQALFGVQADMATYGKVIGGGLPIGALAGKAACLDALDGGSWQFGDDSSPEADMTFFAGTFVRHPLALAASRAVLRHLKQSGPELQAGLNRTTTRMADELNRFFDVQQLPIHVAHFGSQFRFHFPPELPYINLLFYHVLERGIYIRETHQNCFLSTAHSEADVARIIQVIQDSVGELQDADFLPVSGAAAQSLAQTVSEATRSAEAGEAASLPLSEAQKEIWVACQLEPEVSRAYNESFTARFRGALDVAALRAAIQDVIARHDALRTTFSADGQCQKVAPSLAIEIPLIDWSRTTAEDRASRIAAIPAEEANQAFDLVNGPLVRVRILKVEADLHLLVFTAHHLVCDGWSSNVILNELSALYSAKREEKTAALPPPASYGEYVRLEAEAQQSPEWKAAEAWWRDLFATPVPRLELPTDHPHSASQSKRGATRRRVLGAELHQALKRVGAQHGSTLFAVLAAAFKVFLHRLSGQEEIVIGVFSAGQARVGKPDLVGHCVNMLPVRSRLEGNPAFKDYLLALKSILLDVQEHEDYTYGRLLQQLKLPREPGRLPLVEVVFNVEPKETGLKFVGLEVEVDQNPQGFVNFDLFLNINDTGAGLILDLEYNTALFGQYTIDRWLGHYETLLRDIVAHPNASIGQLALLSEAERQQVLVDWNNTAAPYPADACLHTLLEERAEAVPEAVAVISENGQQTYLELNRRANQLARYLQSLGVGPGKRVGICLERSVEMVVAMLGVLKAGAAYVPLDAAYPKDRLAFMIRDSRMPILLTQAKVLDALPEFEAAEGEAAEPIRAMIVCLDTDWKAIGSEAVSNPISRTTAEDLAYLIYTSGTTGQPKGVEIEHRSIVNHLCWRLRTFPMTPTDRFLHKASASFDISVWEIFAPLLAGAQLVLAKPGGEQDAAYLVKWMADQRVTHAHFGPAMLRLILEEPEFERCTALRRVFCGGEPLPAELQERFLERSAAEFYSQYGPTETTVDVTYCRCSTIAKYPLAPIGRPIANTQIYILDGRQQPVPIGVAGELYIGGACVARGYLNQPALTAEKFIRHPFHNEPGARLFRTGDRARFRADGNIEFLGRIDQQIKIRGFRVEPEEIQTVLAQHQTVRESVVVAHEDGAGDRRLVAYVVPSANLVESGTGGAETEWLSDLVSQFETGYGAAIEESSRQSKENHDPTLNIYAWSGLENTEAEVSDWLERIATRILAYQPKRLLEIGCGTGMVVSRLAPHCEEFWGTDLSQKAIDNLEQRLRAGGPEFSRVKLLRRMADDFSGIPTGTFDGIILNAVVEYFPSVDYLLRVLAGAVQALAPGGFIFLGDVPNLALQETYHLNRQLLEAADTEETVKIKQRAQLRLGDDRRLLLETGFWRALPREMPEVSHVEIQLIESRFHNELSKLLGDTHYNVVLHVNPQPGTSGQPEWLDWRRDGLSADEVRRRLTEGGPACLGVTQVPHDRVGRRLRAVETLSNSNAPRTINGLKNALAAGSAPSDLEELRNLADALPYIVEVTWSNSGEDGLCDVVFCRPAESGERRVPTPSRHRESAQPLRAFANNPIQIKLAQQVVPQLRQHLEKKVPEFMIPSAFVLLDRLPLTRAGKLDRRALPPPDFGRAALEEPYVAPRTALEEALCEIWKALLGIKQVGVQDNFFEMGGHSLLAIQVLSRLRQSFHVDLPMSALFEQPTVAKLASAIEEHLAAEINALSEEEAQRYVKTI